MATSLWGMGVRGWGLVWLIGYRKHILYRDGNRGSEVRDEGSGIGDQIV
jgi:hypothetical protein